MDYILAFFNSHSFSFLASLFHKNSFLAVVNLLLLGFFIFVGALLGSVLKCGKNNEKSNHRIGIAAAFICVPFLSSFLHLSYSSLLLPLKETAQEKYIEQIFLLISISGISAYLGYGLLDSIANRVLQSQVDEINSQQKETSGEIDELKHENSSMRETTVNLSLEVLYLKALGAVEKATTLIDSGKEDGETKLAIQKKCLDAIKFLDEGLLKVDKEKDYKTYDRFMVLKAFVLKRLNKMLDALHIIEELLSKDTNNPILLYNLGCYKYLTCDKSADILDEIKALIIKALTVKTNDEMSNKRQKKLFEKVISKVDADIADLFSAEEIEDIKSKSK